MFFGTLIVMAIEIYMEIVVVVYLNFLPKINYETTHWGETVGTYTSYFGIIIGFVILPCSALFLTVKRPPKAKMLEPDGIYQRLFGALYDELRVNDRW